MTRFAALAFAALSLLSLPSCFESTYEPAESEVLLRFLPEKDELLLLELEHGIKEGGKSPEPMRAAADALRGIAEGKRVYPASGDFFATDLDELLKRAGEPAEKEVTGQERADLLEFANTVHVEDHGLYLDGERGLSLYRLTRLEHFRRVLEITSQFVNRSFRKDGENALPPDPGFPLYDEASRELFRAAVAKDHPWVGIQGAAIVFDMPMTSASAARCLAWIAGEGRTPDDWADEVLFFQQVSAIEISAGHARLSFGEASSPATRFTYHAKNAGSSQKLIDMLRKDGVTLGASDAPRKALAKLEPPPPGGAKPK